MRVRTTKSFAYTYYTTTTTILYYIGYQHLYIALYISLLVVGAGSCNHRNTEEGLSISTLYIFHGGVAFFYLPAVLFLSLGAGHVTQQQQLVVCQEESPENNRDTSSLPFTHDSHPLLLLFVSADKRRTKSTVASKHSKENCQLDGKKKKRRIQPAANVSVGSSSFSLSVLLVVLN